MSKDGYHHNHYVPRWYQKAFMLPGQSHYYYLDLKPETVVKDGHRWTRRDLKHWGTIRCFAQNDLYTTRWGNIDNTDIEKFFFGGLDDAGKEAVAAYADYELCNRTHESFQTFIRYMSAQKLRTPKGLAWLKLVTGQMNQNVTMRLLQYYHRLFCATWADCIWQVADATQSPTKFIISDHPVTVYNRDCFPGSENCLFPREPDIRLAATQTIFPLSLNKVLILTNLAWVRDPYQRATATIPNDRLMRETLMNMEAIQTGRLLSEEEVLEINYIIKRRAYRYLAAADREWLYPEARLRSTNWRKLGNGYLLMPDPRHLHMGGEIFVGWKGGGSDAWGPYRHRPWEKGYEDKARDRREFESLERFQAEWSFMFGPTYRGRPQLYVGREPAGSESKEMFDLACALDESYRRRPGERQRRRRLIKE